MLVLTILKIIGILLLALLGLLFSAALLVLVVPLRYRIWMEYRESLKAKVSVSWLLKMAELKAVYDGELNVDVRALGSIRCETVKKKSLRRQKKKNSHRNRQDSW